MEAHPSSRTPYRIDQRAAVLQDCPNQRIMIFRVSAIFTALLLAAAFVHGQGIPAGTGDLPYGAGFRVIHTFDHSRVYGGRQGRPMQIAVWYPTGQRAPKLAYSDYLKLYLSEERLSELSKAEIEENLGFWRTAFSGRAESGTRVEDLLGHKTNAVPGAAPADGKFPVIVYGAGGQGEAFENSLLFETLAASGFVVLASPSVGPYAHKTVVDPVGLEAAARDMEFLLAKAAEIPEADLARVGLAGWSWGGLAAMLVQMRNPGIDAVLSLDGSIAMHADKIRRTAFYDPDRIRVPLMLMTASGNRAKVAEFVEEVDYAKVFIVELPAANHSDFSAYNYIAMNFAASLTGEEQKRKLSYEIVVEMARGFFGNFLVSPGNPARLPAHLPQDEGLVSVTIKDPLPLPPTQEEYFTLIREKGFAAAKKVFHAVRSRDPDYQIFEAFEATVLADRLFKAGRIEDAIAVAKLRVEAYPEDYLSYEWVANLYFKMKDWSNALAYYSMAYGMARSLEQTPEIRSELDFYQKRIDTARVELAK